MLLKDLKKNMILPKKEILINKIVKLRGKEIHIISITLEENRNVLWAIYRLPYCLNEERDIEEIPEYASNREEMINSFSQELNSYYIHISEIIIQKQKMTFSSSRSSYMYGMGHEGYMQLQHFVEIGMSTINWDEVDLGEMAIVAYVQNQNEDFPSIDLSEELDITLKVDRESKQVLINQSMCVEFSEMEKGNRFCFYGSFEKRTHFFYIDKVGHHDIWEESNRIFESEWAKSLSQNQIEQMKKEHTAHLEEICPKGMNLLILEYESEDDIQLNFYSKEYLDKKPVHRTSALALAFFTINKELGINGFKRQVSVIKPIKKDFNDSIDVELFSYFLEIPEEIVKV
ncbi:hypothetical protein JMF89_10430 [Clostridiaceae bacterium UIB06]|uniref:Uncharacterized protein n=1 Tax=Clostridium thailandense TaxID=2794346 RepID=A0A949TT43_9CLOT|nr:hypothetical protein [Clostridium thailandense]MBV7274872.1 hypothetical protein [Clostridium thailandense]MCH5137617.1 hypothetical protein [Clostridiaceae bacterium UIB06]